VKPYLSYIIYTVWRIVRSVFAAFYALVCIISTGINRKSDRSGSATLRSPVRRPVATKRIHRLGRALLVGSFILTTSGMSHGYDITNIAVADYEISGRSFTLDTNPAIVSVTIHPSDATVEFLHHVADPSGTLLPATDFSTTPAPGTFVALNPLPGSGILTSTTHFEESELIVISVTDPDQNLEPWTVNTIIVNLVSTTGDLEHLLLRETGENTGIFIGYIYSGSNLATNYDGYLSAPTGSSIDLSYQDNNTTRTASATVVGMIAPTLWLQLEADRNLVAPGDTLGLTLDVENIDPAPPTANSASTSAYSPTPLAASLAPQVSVSLSLPSGFQYRANSAKVEGVPIADPVLSANGQTLTFTLGDLPPLETRQITVLTSVGAISPGSYTSSTVASSLGTVASNTAKDAVQIRDPFGADKSYLAGRVLAIDSCSEQDSYQELSGIRLFLEDGTYVITDEQGRYHIEGMEPGTHVVQLDPATYPEGLEPILCEDHTRSAGNPASRFLELQPGTLWRADFYLAYPPASGEVSIAMDNAFAIGEAATYTVLLGGHGVSLDNMRLEVELPHEAEYLPGSSLFGGHALMDPVIEGRTLFYDLPPQTGEWNSQITFRTLIDDTTDTGEMLANATLHFDTESDKGLMTPAAESALIWISRGERREVQELLLQPKFETLNAELNTEDRAVLADAVEQLKLLDLIKIYVIGHTDARRIRWHQGMTYHDNFELSEARAEAVARELIASLELDPEQVITIGMAAADPLNQDDTEEAQAFNRRTDLRVLHRVVINPEMDKVISSGGEVKRFATETRRPAAKAPSDLPLGILSAKDGDTLADPISAVKIRLDNRLQPKLLLDGEEISNESIGFKLLERENRTVVMTYVGIDFGAPGEHTLVLQGVDPFGNPRFEQQLEIIRTGEIASIRVLETEGNIADGRTPIRIRLELRDASGKTIHAASKLEVRSGELIPAEVRQTNLLQSPEDRLANLSQNGWTSFEPVDQSGRYLLTLGHGEVEVDVDIFVQPEQREWILVGLASGTAGTHTVLDGVEPLADGTEDGYYDEGRLAFFARGQVKGNWLLTVAYDSDKEDRRNQSLYQVIDPDSYYTLYGDTTDQGYAAASAENLYVRIERDRFYAVFGDLNSGLNVTELSRYNRSLTGFKSEYLGKKFGYTAFASETEQSFVRDELPGDGTSGLYRLSRAPLVLNSETIVIETRDRFHSETILKSHTLQRHIDYDIDYTAGTHYFKEPIASRDVDLNPITIVAEYETHDLASSDLTYGGRGYLKPLGDTLEVGFSGVHEGADTVVSDLYGIDTALHIDEHLTIKGEWATSQTESPSGKLSGDAWLGEATYSHPGTEARLYAREQQENFGLGHQPSSEVATRKIGGDIRTLLTEHLSIDAELFSQDNLSSDTQRWVGETGIGYQQELYTLSTGLRHARDKQTDGKEEISDQVFIGGDWKISKRLTLTGRHEQSLGNNDNRDYPTRTLLGSEYRLTSAVTLFAQQEFTQGERADTEGTRVGFRASPWDGAQVRTSMEQQLSENSRRSFANLGLSQSFQVSPKLSLDVSLDRSQTLSGDVTSSIHPDQPPAAGSPEEYTAVSSGISYRESNWSFDNRVEFRAGESEDRWGIFAGSIVEPREDLGLSFSGRMAHSDQQDGQWSRDIELRLGLAHRPEHRTWLLLDRLDLIHNADDDGNDEQSGWRIVNRFNSHWRATKKLHLAVNTGIRYIAEEIDNENYDALTTLLGSEVRYDLTPHWDIGVHASTLNAWETKQSDYNCGASLGFSPAKDLWLSLGYNLTGFKDQDFSAADYTAEGAFIRFRVKFDQQSVRDAVELFTR